MLILTSEIDVVAKDIARHFVKPISSYKTAYIPTAGEAEGDYSALEDKNRQGLINAGFNLFSYSLKDKTFDQIENDLMFVDIIHVNGGNTFYLLWQARKSGFDKFIKRAVAKGKIYTGSSAGSITASPDISPVRILEKNTYQKELSYNNKSFGLCDFIVFPHWGSNDFKNLYLRQRLEKAYTTEHKIILLSDYQYVIVEEGKYKIVDIRDK